MNNGTAVRKIKRTQQPASGKAAGRPANLVYRMDRLTLKMVVIGAVTVITVIAVAAAVIAMNNRVAGIQSDIARIERRTRDLNGRNDDLKLKVADLMSSSRLEEIAGRAGLDLNDTNTRNVTK